MSKISLKSNNKQKALLSLLLVVALLIGVNVLSNYVHASFDLTQEKRFSVTPATKKFLRELKEPVHVKVLLKTGVPAHFEKLRASTRDMLSRFRDISGNKLSYEFTDPIEGKSGKELQELYKSLEAKGAVPRPISNQLDGKQKTEEQIVFPYAFVSGNGKEFTVPLFEYHTGMDQGAILNYSASVLEYKLASTAQQLFQPERDQIAYVLGHGEAIGNNTIDALLTLEGMYKLDTIDLTRTYEISPAYKCAIICKPTQAFSEKDKFKIDQYVMHGGKVLWFIDQCNVSMDTLQNAPSYTVLPYELNLDDLLFKYGARINKNLVEDLEANPIPVVTGQQNNQSQQSLYKWVYFPVFTPMSKHPIVNNMDAVMSKFCSTIDTITTPSTTKTVLLSTSMKSRALGTPLTVNLNSLQYALNPALFTKKHLPTAICIEGKFRSLYETVTFDDAFVNVYRDSLKKEIKKESPQNKMIVAADADIILNDYSQRQGPLEMGFYRYSRENFANKTFLLNCLEYLTNDNNLLAARNKDVKLRLLDSDKVAEQRTMWQIINISLPIAICIIAGSLFWFFRKKRYEQKA
ncbi:MAG: gliding motility-associated transporter substrate-binding protein GldG [Bacteroidota bacterium]|jgi:gliding-associated putative ABC transporter substrate-binding component GldG